MASDLLNSRSTLALAASADLEGVHSPAPTGPAPARRPVLRMVSSSPRERSLTDRHLETACHAAPGLGSILRRHGEGTIEAYLASALRVQPEPFQDRTDLLDVVAHHCKRLLGPAAAAAVRADLEASPVILTANHHGVDFFAQSLLGTLIFSQRSGSPRSVPVLACGSVAMNNPTYPLGMLLYGTTGSDVAALPRRLPLFSNKMHRNLVCCAAPIDAALVQRAAGRLDRLHAQGALGAAVSETARAVLAEDYGSPDTLALPSYSEQAVLLNRRIWRRLFAQPDEAPELAYLEMESIARSLLLRDLADPRSLVAQMLFVTPQRERLLQALDGVRACWRRDALARRIELARRGDNPADGTGGGGTVFFWGIRAGRRVPLTLEDGERLVGVDDHGSGFACPFTPDAIGRELAAGRLVPSTPACHLVLSLGRGLTCVGGYFQMHYLPAIRGAVVASLQACGWTPADLRRIAGVPTDVYLSGMQPVMHRLPDGMLVPAGPLEIAAAGGLRREALRRLRTTTVREAHAASLLETLPDLAPEVLRTPDAALALARDTARCLPDLVTV